MYKLILIILIAVSLGSCHSTTPADEPLDPGKEFLIARNLSLIHI